MCVQESQQFEGQVLVAREAEGHQTGGASHVVDTYEPVAGTTYCHLCGLHYLLILIRHIIHNADV